MKAKYIPALKFKFLTKCFDIFCSAVGLGKEFRNIVISSLGIIKKQYKILDAGCGTGSLAITLKQKYKNIELYAIDIDKDVLKIAENKNRKNNIKIFFKQAPVQSLPYKSSFFDIVYSSLVIHHLKTKDKILAMKEIHRILKKNGVFILADFGRPKNFITVPFSWFSLLEEGYDNYKGLIPKFLSQAGFKDIKPIAKFRFNIEILKARK